MSVQGKSGCVKAKTVSFMHEWHGVWCVENFNIFYVYYHLSYSGLILKYMAFTEIMSIRINIPMRKNSRINCTEHLLSKFEG